MTPLEELEKLLAGWKQACARTDDPLQDNLMTLKALELAYGIEDALPGLIESARRVDEMQQALEAIVAERPAITDGLSQFQWECIRSIARAALKGT